MKCIQCGVEFDSKRSDAKYCSDKCRKADKREIKSDKVSEIIPEVVRDNVRDKDPIEIIPQDEWRRDYLIEHAQEFKDNYKETKDCPNCIKCRTQFSKSKYVFCAEHMKVFR